MPTHSVVQLTVPTIYFTSLSHQIQPFLLPDNNSHYLCYLTHTKFIHFRYRTHIKSNLFSYQTTTKFQPFLSHLTGFLKLDHDLAQVFVRLLGKNYQRAVRGERSEETLLSVSIGLYW